MHQRAHQHLQNRILLCESPESGHDIGAFRLSKTTCATAEERKRRRLCDIERRLSTLEESTETHGERIFGVERRMEMETVAELRRKLGTEELQRSELQGKAAEIQAWRAVAEEQARLAAPALRGSRRMRGVAR